MLKLIVQKNPKSPVSEAYRTLRTNIQFASLDNALKTIVVTSSGPQEGKSTTAANLALVIAETSKKVLIIDCDLRKPTLHKNFGVSNKIGLTNLLIENLNLEDIMVTYSENLYLLPSGTLPPSPAEMLSSNKMKSFIEEARDKFDYIIIDSPPIIAVTDAQILSTIADGVLLVASSGQVEREALNRSKSLLERVNANILGIVLNKVEVKGRRGYGYYYYGSESEGKKRK